MIAATRANVRLGWQRRNRRRSRISQRSSPAIWVSGWITSGTERAHAPGQPGRLDVGELVDEVVGLAPVAAGHLAPQPQRGHHSRDHAAREGGDPAAAVPAVPLPATGAPDERDVLAECEVPLAERHLLVAGDRDAALALGGGEEAVDPVAPRARARAGAPPRPP